MKLNKLFLVLLIAVVFFSFAGCKKSADPKDQKKSTASIPGDLKSKVSYVIGHDIGTNLKKSMIDIDTGAFLTALKEGLKGSKSKYSAEEQQKIMGDLREDIAKKTLAKAEENKKAGKDYLEKNKANKDVVTLASGLQYKIIKEGTGPIPKSTDTVKVNYIGKLSDGTEFDNSYTNGQPAVFPVTGVIKGWQEALQLMKTGSKWEVYIPSELGYGEQGMQGMIPGNSVLVFEVELLSIEPPVKK